mmetsp:Transcript_38060/g.91826  ORF Transcript_38060/g.91826 Transcript_38060/m.91826 type:complete len:279 (+) Transcript_38060:1863-2699(+)
MLLGRLQEELGNKWTRIAESIPGRTDNDVKNRWHSLKRKQITQLSAAATLLRRAVIPTVPSAFESDVRKWTEDEDILMGRPQQDLGNKRAKIVEQLTGHSSLDMNNRRSKNLRCRKRAEKPTAKRAMEPAKKSRVATIAKKKRNVAKNDHLTPTKKHPVETTMEHLVSAEGLETVGSLMTRQNIGNPPVQAEDIFSPSYFPRQLSMASTATATFPGTPAIPLSTLSSCYSGPFISNTSLFKERSIASITTKGKILFPYDDNEAEEEYVGVMSPIPYAV